MWYSRWDSNPHYKDFKSSSSASWDTGAYICLYLLTTQFNYIKKYNLVKIQRTKNYQKFYSVIKFAPNTCSLKGQVYYTTFFEKIKMEYYTKNYHNIRACLYIMLYICILK